MGAPADLNLRLRRLPKIDDLLRAAPCARLLAERPRWAVVEAVRAEVEALRVRLREPGGDAASHTRDADEASIDFGAVASRAAELCAPSLARVVNATGVVLHTNLGRAPLARRAIERIVETAAGYSNLEYRLAEGERGSRHDHVGDLLVRLAGAEAHVVVNNGAAAVLLVLASLVESARARHATAAPEVPEVVVSRGELVEIGGSFRVPDVLSAAGVRLVEVGTTNRTHLADYERAISPRTIALLKVHPSNFAVIGFTSAVGADELGRLGRARGVPTVVDLGSGNLLDGSGPAGLLGDEPGVRATLAAGADVVTCSGDKLLGGPQAGLVLGRRDLVSAMRSHPLLRALRPSKLALAALEATLELYRDGLAHTEVPALSMLAASAATLEARARRLAERAQAVAPWLRLSVVPVRGAVGGGALPGREPPSFAVAVRDARKGGHLGEDALDERLRRASPPVIARIAEGSLLLDVRTLRDDEIDLVAAALLLTKMD